MKNNKSNRALRVGANIVFILLLLGAFQMFFDENYTNDHFGGLFLITFWMLRSIYGFTISLKEGNKKLALIDLGLVIFAFYFLFSQSIKYFL
ncbi:hypothetical protein [Bacillus pseudomycoides]|uniref:Group-specific protein n=1 Tax=Bacillus pseudomycoides TaxID=64104 RepID=A0ABD6SYC3_9BACI|nr:hypothetical protein [Bacillus pseudomycoides]EEM02911.1 hypothetical protein bmyco0002_46780 [Bacillus pseudomycoides]KFN09850.1 putative membrane protein [Bacillus pseudomycoides]MDR4188540.1 hypothetical protein [Bacillus pseudomycoides]PEP63521.1 hypothetical protein CN564_04350 [Bacillus pseudomycoides]PEP70122.1 hypothetical protein CN584_31300 [Bacillus pseudomycoides]